MKKEEVFERSLELANKSDIAMVGSNSDDGYPNIKAMLKIKNEGLKKIWFSTNTSSKRVAQFRKDLRLVSILLTPCNSRVSCWLGKWKFIRTLNREDCFGDEGSKCIIP
jgi:general stress protein 26